jgi:hypothetical protein
MPNKTVDTNTSADLIIDVSHWLQVEHGLLHVSLTHDAVPG